MSTQQTATGKAQQQPKAPKTPVDSASGVEIVKTAWASARTEINKAIDAKEKAEIAADPGTIKAYALKAAIAALRIAIVAIVNKVPTGYDDDLVGYVHAPTEGVPLGDYN